MVSLVSSVALLSGACTPKARPAGLAGGTALTAVGAGMVIVARSACSAEGSGLGCIFTALMLYPLGLATAASGLTITAIAALSPSEPEAPAAEQRAGEAASAGSPAPAPGMSPPAAPGSPEWRRALGLSPSRSPSAPSGSPLAFD